MHGVFWFQIKKYYFYICYTFDIYKIYTFIYERLINNHPSINEFLIKNHNQNKVGL